MDGSQKSFNGFDVAKQIAKKNDKIYSVYLTNDSQHGEEVENKVKQKLENIDLKAQHVSIKTNYENDFKDGLLNFVNENDKQSFDFLIIGCNGLKYEAQEKNEIGSTASFVIQKCLINVIVV